MMTLPLFLVATAALWAGVQLAIKQE